MIVLWKRLPIGIRTTLWMGLLWGGLMLAAFQLLLPGMGAGTAERIAVFAAGGLAYGFTMAVFLTLVVAVQATSWGREDIRSVPERQVRDVRLSLPVEEALSAAKGRASNMGFRVTEQGPGGFAAEKRLRLIGICDALVVRAAPVAGGVQVRVACHPRKPGFVEQVRCASAVRALAGALERQAPYADQRLARQKVPRSLRRTPSSIRTG